MAKSVLIPLLFLLTAACSDAADTSKGQPSPAERDVADAAASSAAALSCGINDGSMVTADGIGHLRIGKTTSEIRATCRVVRDTVGLGAEAMPERRLSVDLGRDTVEAVVVDDRVWRIHLDGEAFRAEGGLGVGSTIAHLRDSGAPRVALGEGIFILIPERCGLSFRLDNVHYGPSTTVAQLPADARVVEVLVVGCSAPRT